MHGTIKHHMMNNFKRFKGYFDVCELLAACMSHVLQCS